MHAAHLGYEDMVEVLLEHPGVDVNFRSTVHQTVPWLPTNYAPLYGYRKLQTALHKAAEAGHLGVVETLIANGAEVNARDSENKTPLIYAQEKKHEFVAEVLQIHSGLNPRKRRAEGPKYVRNVRRRTI